jgi:hypothetical protein
MARKFSFLMPENLQIAFMLSNLFEALQDRILAGPMPKIMKELIKMAKRAKARITKRGSAAIPQKQSQQLSSIDKPILKPSPVFTLKTETFDERRSSSEATASFSPPGPCPICKNPGHWAKNYPTAICYYCKKQEHLKRECPKLLTEPNRNPLGGKKSAADQ